MNFISKEGLQRICDEYPVGAKFVKTVPFRHKLKPTSPRNADTAVNLFLMVCCVPAVCDSRCCSVTLEGKQHSVVF